VGLVERSAGGATPVARDPGLSRAGDRGDDAGGPVHPADDAVAHLDEVEVARAIEAHLVGLVQVRRCRGPSVAGVTGLSGASDGSDGAALVDPSHAVVAHVTDIERAVGAAGEAVGVVELRFRRGSAVAGEALLARAGNGRDTTVGRSGPRR